jgi:alkylation response protein AidB-like acyl-CoA dehydrogenase
MDLRFSAEELDFAEDVRSWVKANLAASTRDKVLNAKRLSKQDYTTWHASLNDRGWVVPAWPEEHGGTGWTAVQRHLFDEVLAEEGAPELPAFSVKMIGPVLIAFANDAQKSHYLPRIRSGEHWWAQGFSEPGSGSDLASLRTKAVLDGDHWVVNGQKTWTTMAQYADMIFCLVRTDPSAKKQVGISMLLIDMKTPGITVRPIITIDGAHEVNEVFFDDVRVPTENLVGEVNKGWDYAKFLLGHERTGIARVGRSKRALLRLKTMAEKELADGVPLAQVPAFRDKLANVEIDLMALEISGMRLLAAAETGHAPGAEANMLKIKGSEIQQRLSELMMEAVGPYALPFNPDARDLAWNGEPIGPDYAAPLTPDYFNFRKTTIYGGSNEIQRNILAKAKLGL